MRDELVGLGVSKIDDWTDAVERFTLQAKRKQTKNRVRYTEAQFLVAAMIECLQRHLGIQYNFSFAEGDYDASDSRNLFIHGPLTGFGGTCASLPVVYCAIGRRLRYPIGLAETREHAFCRWDGPDGERFCFDAAGRGFIAHREERYRAWPSKITPKEEKNNGYIRRKTTLEELAMLAANRGNCLLDNFQFGAAIEAHGLAHQLVPKNHAIHDAFGLSMYSTKLWEAILRIPQNQGDMSIHAAIDRAAKELDGPDVNQFRRPAVENIARIVRNRRHRDFVAIIHS